MAGPPGILSRAAARVEAIVRAARGLETSRVADVGAAHYGLSAPPRGSEERRLLENFGVYESRLSPELGPTRTRWALWPGDDLTPETIIGAQRDAVTSGIPLRWVELVDQVFSRDGHYASCANQRVADVVKGTWRLTPSHQDDAGVATANFVDEAYRSTSRFTEGLGWLLYSNLYSYTATEVEWEVREFSFPGPRGEPIGPFPAAVPRRLFNTHPKHFRFDMETDDPLLWVGPRSAEPLPIGKFVFMEGDGLHPIKVRRGHAWQSIWYSLFRSMGWAAWAVHVDRFSLPTPLIKYEGDVAQYQEYVAAYTSILNALGQGKGAIVPKNGAEFTVLDPPNGGRSNDPSAALSDACDAGQSIRVLGGQLNNKIGNVGSFAASSNHIDIKYSLEELDAMRAWERIDEQLSAPLLQFNAEELARALNKAGYNVTPEQLCRRVPKGKHHIPGKTDPFVEMQIMDIAVNKLGLPISMAGAFARNDFQKARDDRDRVPGEAQPVAKGGALVSAAEAAKAGEGGAVNPDVAAEKAAEKTPAEGKSPAGEESNRKKKPAEGEEK